MHKNTDTSDSLPELFSVDSCLRILDFQNQWVPGFEVVLPDRKLRSTHHNAGKNMGK